MQLFKFNYSDSLHSRLAPSDAFKADCKRLLESDLRNILLVPTNDPERSALQRAIFQSAEGLIEASETHLEEQIVAAQALLDGADEVSSCSRVKVNNDRT